MSFAQNSTQFRFVINFESKFSTELKKNFGPISIFFFCAFREKIEEGTLDLGNDDFNPFILCLPAMCDMLGTSTMYFGLTLTFASSFQMLRGAVMFFTAVFSVLFLKAIIQLFRWAGIGVVIVGLAAVGVSDMLKEMHDGGGKDLSLGFTRKLTKKYAFKNMIMIFRSCFFCTG